MDTPKINRILRSARQVGLCAGAVERLKNFLESPADHESVSRLEKFSRESDSVIALSDRIGQEFLAHLVAERFRTVTC